MGTEPAYILTRGVEASVRLNVQHYLFKDILGYNLHPSIPIPADGNIRIADLGTGTGIWPFDVVKSLGSKAWVDGFDVSDQQWPVAHNLPPNVSLSIFDCLGDEPPPALHEKYDIVHIRLFLGVIGNCDPSPLLRNALKLLKPGGYLQWVEADSTRMQVKCSPGGSAGACQRIIGLFLGSGVKDQRWVPRLPDMFVDAGLDSVHSHSAREPIWQRRMYADMMCVLARDIIDAVYGVDPADMQRRLADVAEATREVREGAWFSQPCLAVVGRKPERPASILNGVAEPAPIQNHGKIEPAPITDGGTEPAGITNGETHH